MHNENLRATEDLLDKLHGTLAQSLTDQLKHYKEKNEPIPPALYGQIIKFLKDNGIDSPNKAGNPLDDLVDELPDFDDDNIVSFP